MTTIIFGGGSSFGGGVQSNSPGSPTIQATAGSVTTVTGTINQPINNVSTFSSVQYGISPYTYSISSGTLPTGVTLDSTTGIISGIPTATQSSSSVTVSVTDSLGVTASTTATVAFTVGSAIVATANSVAPVTGYINQAISTVTPFSSVTGGTQPYWYFVSSGTLPDRVTLDPTTGLVSGTPTQTYSTASVTFSVRDAGGIVASTTSTISFTVILALVAMPGGTFTVFGYQSTAITSFSAFGSVSGGTAPYTYYVSSGTLPTGIAINSSTGLVSGTPTATQSSSNVTFSVKDANNLVASTTVTVSFTVNSAITATAGATTTVSQQQNTAITSFNPFSSVTGGYTPYTYYTSSGTLPTGITQDTSTGLVSGTPNTVQAASNVVFGVKDSQNSVAATSVTVSFTVTAPSYTINYLIVGGGGHGGAGSACGGGGGGGGGVIASSVSVLQSNTITITVGTGAGPSSGPSPSFFAGSPSSIAAPTVPALGTQTAIGGGSGGSATLSPTGAGSTGASGGGGAHGPGAPLGPGGPGTPGQGSPGGSGTTVSGGGGGGAVGPGTAGTPTAGGVGGSGYTWPFNNIGYGGGGQGAGPTFTPNTTAPFGGGNGGFPGAPPLAYGTNGLTGRGGGGGGGPGLNPTGSPTTWNTGGPGTVILAMPTPNYNPSGYTPSPGITVSTAPASPTTTLITFNIITAYTPATYTYTT
jgi:hypothetical protein